MFAFLCKWFDHKWKNTDFDLTWDKYECSRCKAVKYD